MSNEIRKSTIGGSILKFSWLTFTISILILGVMNSLISATSSLGMIFVLFHITITSVILMSYKSKLKVIFLSAFIARVVVMFWDLLARSIFILPNSGADSEMFYDASLAISNDLSLLGSTRGGVFSDLMGLLFRIIGEQRIVGQYINVLFGLSTIFIVYKTIKYLDVDSRVIKIVLFIVAFFPNSLIMSAIFLREIIPTFLVAVSLMEYIKWLKSSKIKNAVFSLFFIGLASMFHSGVIGITLGYFFGFLFYNSNSNKLKFSARTVMSFVLIILVIAVSFTYFEDIIFRKFRNVEDISDIYTTANVRLGGSAYLKSIEINTPLQFLIYSPVKAFYFLTSPLPMNWRGGMDIFTFLTDSILYLFSLFYYLTNKNKLGTRRSIVIIILWMLLGSSLIFGIGISNAGTAVRHRQKLIPVFLILLAIIMDCRKKLITKKNSKFRSENSE